MRRRRYTPHFGVLLLVLVLALAACASPSRVTYIPEDGAYSAEDLLSALESSDPGSAARVSADEAPEVRQEALADLRQNGADAATLANTLTSQFPTDVIAVPYEVRLGTFDDEGAWIVFEAWGEPGGELTGRRAWVFAHDDLALLAAQSMP